jgi:hypothetical protein
VSYAVNFFLSNLSIRVDLDLLFPSQKIYYVSVGNGCPVFRSNFDYTEFRCEVPLSIQICSDISVVDTPKALISITLNRV